MGFFSRKPKDKGTAEPGEDYTIDEPVFPCLDIKKEGNTTSYLYSLKYSSLNKDDSSLPIRVIEKKDESGKVVERVIETYVSDDKGEHFAIIKDMDQITVDDQNMIKFVFEIPGTSGKTTEYFLPYTWSPTELDPIDHLSHELSALQRGHDLDKNCYNNEEGLKPKLFKSTEEAKKYLTLEPKNYFLDGYTPETKLIYIPYKDKNGQTKFLNLTLQDKGNTLLSFKKSDSLNVDYSLKEIEVDSKTGKIAIMTGSSTDKYHLLPINAKDNPELVKTLQDVAGGKITTTNLNGFEKLSHGFENQISKQSEILEDEIQRDQTIEPIVEEKHTTGDSHGAGADDEHTAGAGTGAGGASVPPVVPKPVVPHTPSTAHTGSRAPETTETKGTVLGEKSTVGFNGNKGINAPHINPADNSISIDLGIKGGHFQEGASQKITLTDKPIDPSTKITPFGKNLVTITRQDPLHPDHDIALASVTKNGDNLMLNIDNDALEKCLQDYETRTGKKLTLAGNVFHPQKIIMSDSNELQGVQIEAGDGTTVTISFDAAGMRIVSNEAELKEDGTPKLDEKGKPVTHEEKAFLSAGTRPLNFTINPQFLHEAATIPPVVDSEGNMIDPPLPTVEMNGRISENIMIMSVLKEREKAQKAYDEATPEIKATMVNPSLQIISNTFGKNNEIKIESVPVFEEGSTKPYYLNIIREKGKPPRIFLDLKSDKGVEKAPKFYEILEANVEATSVKDGKILNFGIHLGIKDSSGNKIRINLTNLTFDNISKNGFIDYIDNIHTGSDGYSGLKFNENDKGLTVLGYYQKSSGNYVEKIPDGTTKDDYKEIYARSSTRANVISGKNTIANLQNTISDVLEEEPEEVKDFVYEPKISYNTYTGKKLEFGENGTTSINLPMDKKFGFEKDSAQKITLVNDKTIHAGENNTKPADPSEEKIISVTDPKLGGETVSFTRKIEGGIPSYTMGFNAQLFQKILEEYKKANNKDFDLDLSLLTSVDGKIQFDVDKIIISDDMKIQGVEIKAAGKTIAIDMTAAGYMISNGKQVARHRMDKQPLDFTFNSSILYDANNNNKLTLENGKISDELQVMAIQQARQKAGDAAKTEPVTLKLSEKLTLYSIPVKVGEDIHYLWIRHEKGKTPEVYTELESPAGSKKLAPKFSKMTHFNFEMDIDKDGKKTTGLYIALREQDRDVPIRVGVNNVDVENGGINQNLISVFEEIQNDSGNNFHFNNEPEAGAKLQGYYQFDTNPDGSKTCKFVNKPADEDPNPAKPSVEGRSYQPAYAIPSEKEYTPVWDTVAQLKNDAQKETVEKEPEEKKQEKLEMPKVPKRRKKKVNEYMSSLTIIGFFCLSSILAIINPFFLILSAVFAGALLMKESGLLAALVETFGPRDRDALDVHNDIVNTRSKIVEIDREIKDIDAKIEEVAKRAGKNISPATCKARYQNLVLLTNLVGPDGKPIDISRIEVEIDPATGKLVLKDKMTGNAVSIKDKQGFTDNQIKAIIENQILLQAKQDEIARERDAEKRQALEREKAEIEEKLESAYGQDYKTMQELKNMKKAREKKREELRNKAKGLTREGQALYNGGTPYDLDFRGESTDDKGNYHSGTDHYYNFGETDKNDAANRANADYEGDASKVTTKSEGRSI